MKRPGLALKITQLRRVHLLGETNRAVSPWALLQSINKPNQIHTKKQAMSNLVDPPRSQMQHLEAEEGSTIPQVLGMIGCWAKQCHPADHQHNGAHQPDLPSTRQHQPQQHCTPTLRGR